MSKRKKKGHKIFLVSTKYPRCCVGGYFGLDSLAEAVVFGWILGFQVS
jgi:hypothetical protein